MKRLPVVALAAVMVSPLWAASVYKWTDRDGVVRYDDTQLVDSTKMTREYMDTRKVPAYVEQLDAIPQEFVEDVQRRCVLARERVQNYRSASQLYGRTPDGTEYLMSPRQVALMIADTEQLEKRYCAPNAVRQLFAGEATPAEPPASHPAKSAPARQ